jgi:hypothetical protein
MILVMDPRRWGTLPSVHLYSLSYSSAVLDGRNIYAPRLAMLLGMTRVRSSVQPRLFNPEIGREACTEEWLNLAVGKSIS